ncbi:ArgR family transcriptional regulator [Fluoribacter dumoffii]|uniref:arginine repressor n=1 Tax=Fluoribacter dumoffii TaxID=463 RepID=UPI00026C7FC3|nr:arginine repressor ArgR [Fluoribacter dumoffii]MCW8385399.1 ArgR family transcriptional regulator [Fluoribacter dumoffii]MCW8418452.1 ArgR family transcriptional regulator [Fluoribacter dumoffii]MCW8453706.1 ArgR family transcriptional regulator [Fluoribacter dumoffii]MCW8462223.1 ArgR family transcriptional regulator [Fluoribacter dumoffii]MCW8482435.1 ArgR family transcriptional regulator [Fluoribacter dumoffii]
MSQDAALDGHILNIVQTEKIAEQVDLQNSLKARGYNIPQATLSRRLKKLKIAKIGGTYQAVDFNMPNLPLVLNMQVSDFGLIVLHTHPGNANSLAFYIDRKFVSFSSQMIQNSGILGTIAGDDTVLLITKSKEQLNQVIQLLHEEFPYLKK